MVVAGQNVGANIALCDPTLTYDIPKDITAATGMDALTHAIEAYISKWSSPVTDALAIDSICKISNSLEAAVTNSTGKNREEMMLGSILAGMAFNSALLGLVHSLAHPLSAHYDTPHGVANAIFLPYVIEYNLDAITTKRKPLAKALGLDVSSIADSDLNESIVKRIQALSDKINIPTLKSLGIPEKDFEMLAREALEEMSTMTNPKESNVEDIIKIIEKAYTK
jgi:alcohol dehydrogenase class IV